MHITDGWCWRVFMCGWVPFVLSTASMPSHCRNCLMHQDAGAKREKVSFLKWKTAACCQEQPPAWLPSSGSLWGHENYNSESVNGRSVGGEDLKRADIFVFKKRRWVVDIHCNTSSCLFYFCDPFRQARPEVSRRLRSRGSLRLLSVINWDPNKLLLTWLNTAPWENVSLDIWIADHRQSSIFFSWLKKPSITVYM